MIGRFSMVLLYFLFSYYSLKGQPSELFQHEQLAFNRAMELFHQSQFQWAQTLFNQVSQTTTSQRIKSDSKYYAALCALRLEQPNANGRMEEFLEDFPASEKKQLASFELAQSYFNQGRFPQAMTYFELVSAESLTVADQQKYNFQVGYSYFAAKNKEQAINYFNRVVSSPIYGAQAKYYLGFMAYEGDNYDQAAKLFAQVADDDKYKEKLSYYQADMSFKQGEFEKAIQQGKAALPKATAVEKSELNKIIGESHFNLGQYELCIPYLNEFKGRKGKWNNTDYYQLGYAYYKQNDYPNAIAQFNKIIAGNDFVAQNAYYHLGESYLKTALKQQALNAFKNASEMTFDAKIQEDAALNYAKLSYEIGNSYQPVPDVLQGFITKYPASTARNDIELLLVDSYVTARNYRGAMALLAGMSSPDPVIYQKVAFYHGVELFSDTKYTEALVIFNQAAATIKEGRFAARANFWKAECHFLLNDFTAAMAAYELFLLSPSAAQLTENKHIYYHMAYTCFKLKKYDDAAGFFQKYIETQPADKVRLNDAYLRLGDSRFVEGKYWPAMEAYNKAIEMKGVDADYAAYQKAISYGFVGRNEKKIDDLTKFLQDFTTSRYRDDVLFELGNTYVIEKNNEAAIKAYEQVISQKGTLGAKALLRQALVYYNLSNDNLALTKFKRLSDDYPGTPEAVEAVATARLIYLDANRVEEYAAWVKTLSFVTITDAEIEHDTWSSAEKQYLQNNQVALQSLLGYLAKFPQGLHALKAHYYAGELYYSSDLDRAAGHYQFVIDMARNEYTEPSLVRLAEIYSAMEDMIKEISILQRIEQEADFPQNVVFAQTNLMSCYFNQKQYADAANYANKLLDNPKIDEVVKADAQLIAARAAFLQGDEAKARILYEKLMHKQGEIGAEAAYYNAYFTHKEGKFAASNEAVQRLTKQFSSYKYFGAKGLVLMASNFYALDDSFQATYILETVIKNFTAYTDVVEQANTLLAAIKAEESKTNESIAK